MSNLGVPDFGTCWSCVTDLTMPAIMASGFRVVAEAVARRWQTPQGGLIDDPSYGFDLTNYVEQDLDKGALSAIAIGAASEAEKDQRVLSCTVTVVLQPSGELVVTGKIITAAGPFTMVVSVSQIPTQGFILQSVTGA